MTRRRWLLVTALLVVVLVVLFHVAGGWYFAGVLRDDALDASARRDDLVRDYDVDVLTVVGDTANRWMAIAQCFAGGPEDPPAPGERV